jgi:hypothetical protein
MVADLPAGDGRAEVLRGAYPRRVGLTPSRRARAAALDAREGGGAVAA